MASNEIRKIAIIGHFGGDKVFLDGQTIKTKVFYEELQNSVNGLCIKKVDTYYKKHNLIKLLVDFFVAIFSCKHIIVLVAGNGMRIMFPILHFCSKVLGKRVYHSVIGASLAKRVVKHKHLKKYLNSFRVNWCETKGLVNQLQELGVTNAELLYNCKRLIPVLETGLTDSLRQPYRLCTFSRVMREKGLEDAVCAVKSINDKYGQVIYTLDIYGQIDPAQEEWFENIKKDFPPYVRYRGSVPYDESVEVLKNYFALLFPTHYWTEGVPGTIIDAYASGLPVIASKWENFDNIINDDTGIGYDFDCIDSLTEVLDYIQKNPAFLITKKQHCVETYQKFSPEAVMNIVLQKMRD